MNIENRLKLQKKVKVVMDCLFWNKKNKDVSYVLYVIGNK